MDNINLEKFVYKELQNQDYDLYYLTYTFSLFTQLPQIYAIKKSSVTKQFLKQTYLAPVTFTTQKIHNILHKRPIIIVKSFASGNPRSDNILLCSILKQAIIHLSVADIANSLEKYVMNIQPTSLAENVFSTSHDKIHYFNLFSKDLTLQSIHLKNVDVFFSKHCSLKEKENFILKFVSKRAKELNDINIEKKITNYLRQHWENDISYLEKFFPFSQYLTNQIHPTSVDIFDTYSYSAVIEVNLLKTSKFIGLTTNKINTIADKFFKEVEKYHHAKMKLINDKEHTTFIFQHNDSALNQQSLKETFHDFLTYLLQNDIQKIDSSHCEKWYLHEVILKKLPTTNTISKLNKI